jgi:hypothetical protein
MAPPGGKIFWNWRSNRGSAAMDDPTVTASMVAYP